MRPNSIGPRVSVTGSLQLANSFYDVNDAGDKREETGASDNQKQWEKSKLEHDPADGDHLQNGGDFAGPIRFHIDFAIKQIKHARADENDGVARDHQDRKPDREVAIIGIGFAPVANAQSDDAAEEQTFVGDRIENDTERAALFVATGDIAIKTVADRSNEEDQDRGESLPLKRLATFDALAIINRHGDKRRNHQDPGNSNFVGRGHGASTQL